MPPQFCEVLPGQFARTKLKTDQTTAMLDFAAQPPFINAETIVKDSPAIVGIGEGRNALLTNARVSVPNELITIQARVLGAPRVLYCTPQSFTTKKPASVSDGSWDLRGIKVSYPGTIRSWTMVALKMGPQNPFSSLEEANAVRDRFAGALRTLGISVPNSSAPNVTLRNLTFATWQKELDELFANFAKDFQHLFLVFPKKQPEYIYGKIKSMADVKYGIITTCMDGSKLIKGQPQYMANVGLKVNLKAGGRNQSLDDTSLGIVAKDNTMLVGIDVTHPSPGSAKDAPSVAAMVASIDKHLGQWPVDLRVQRGRQEEVDPLIEMLQSRLALWKTLGKHPNYPENIMIFRDGVSEGQFNMVLKTELPRLQKACELTYPKTQKQPRFFVAVCGKRHHTRFYPTSMENADDGSNCKPGTVVDRGVTESRMWDFFLQAHKGLKGTTRPAHFSVLWDEIFTNPAVLKDFKKQGWTPQDILEDFCHNVSYLYPRATKAVSLITPAKFADLAAERARHYLSAFFDPSDTASSSSGNTENLAAQRELIQVHRNIKDTMFYV